MLPNAEPRPHPPPAPPATQPSPQPAQPGAQTGVARRWYGSAMKSTIDKAGRVVIPVELRERAFFRAGTPLEITLEPDLSIRIRRDVPGPRLVQRDGVWMAEPTAPFDELPEIDLDQVLEEERNRWPK